MHNRAALFSLAALLAMCAALLGGCTAQDSSAVVQSTPDLSVNLFVPYATTTPTVAPTGVSAPFTMDASGKVTVLDSSWVDEDFVSADEEMTQTTYTQLRLGDQGQEVQNLQARLGELGYYSGEVTGVFDTLTEQAVQLFELTFGTMQTGIATSGMQALLFDENAPAYGSEAYNNARSDTYETLQLGDVGSGVLALQYRLQELGYPLENANGQYDAATAKAVSLFYEEYGLAANDVAIIAMQEALFASDAHRYSGSDALPSPTANVQGDSLSQGNIGTAVQEVQQRLAELGYYQGEPTGTFDDLTVQAVMLLQESLGLEQTGVVDARLQTELLSQDAPAYGSDLASAIRVGGYTLLTSGDAGDAVMNLQARLVELGYANGTPNGNYEGATVSAVKLFQRALGQEESGVATSALQARLYSQDAPHYVAPEPTQQAVGDRYYPYSLSMVELSEGSEGDLVVYLQTRLKQLGYYNGSLDGQYGAATAEAVRYLQNRLGLEQTGVASVSLQEHLYSDATPQSDISLFDSTQTFSTLQLGDESDMVEMLQRQLWELGYLDRADVEDSVGTFNEATRQAVIDAQAAMGYVKTDGVATPEFQAFVFSKYCTLIKR